MDIKVKGTSKVGILAFDLDDPYASMDMEKARNVQKVCSALSDFANALRSIRKYDAVPEIQDFDDRLSDKKVILKAQEYYHQLFINCLKDNDALYYLE